MPQSLTRIYLHIVFSTKHREATIDDTIKEDLHSYIGALCRERDCQPVQIEVIPIMYTSFVPYPAR